MLKEVAVTPDVFKGSSYSSPGIDRICLQMLREPLLHEVLVRNLYDGKWQRFVIEKIGELTPYSKELITNLSSQGRLCHAEKHSQDIPDSDVTWCRESLLSHGARSLGCVITTAGTYSVLSPNDILSNVEQIQAHTWWRNRSESLRLRLLMDQYLAHLDLILKHANSIMFIDPHLDPSARNYRDFYRILQACHRVATPPSVEIHRCCYYGTDRNIPDNSEWERRFRDGLSTRLARCNIKLEVFIWDDFHDRFLISNLMGISLPEGFVVDNNPRNLTTWTRLSRKDRDDIQREFYTASRRHTLRHRFAVK